MEFCISYIVPEAATGTGFTNSLQNEREITIHIVCLDTLVNSKNGERITSLRYLAIHYVIQYDV